MAAAVGAPQVAAASGVFAAVVRPGVAAGPAAKAAPFLHDRLVFEGVRRI